jgi:hypothetical protein
MKFYYWTDQAKWMGEMGSISIKLSVKSGWLAHCCVAALCLLLLPLPVGAVPPELVHEESLTGQEQVGGQPMMSVGLARRLLAGGLSRLVLRVADDSLSRGGAPLAAADWLRLKAEALLGLEQFAAVRDLLQEMPEDALTAYPDLTLLLASAEREEGCCLDARLHYSAFLLAHPRHSKRFQAQLGIGLCALEQNQLEEAELQLRLYEQDPDRPRQDLLLQIGLAELARQRDGSGGGAAHGAGGRLGCTGGAAVAAGEGSRPGPVGGPSAAMELGHCLAGERSAAGGAVAPFVAGACPFCAAMARQCGERHPGG